VIAEKLTGSYLGCIAFMSVLAQTQGYKENFDPWDGFPGI
jgi:hypothetical protein